MSSNAFNKSNVYVAAQKVLVEIEAEKEAILNKKRSWLDKLLMIPETASFHRGRQYGIAKNVSFKALNCTTDVVYLDSDEIEAIKDKW